jgi:hypothetical protein
VSGWLRVPGRAPARSEPQSGCHTGKLHASYAFQR